MVAVERQLVAELRGNDKYDDEMLREILFELDVEEARLEQESADPD